MEDKNIYEYTLMLADSSLIMGQRLSEWTGHGPILELDIAITNIALDEIGQARLLYQFAAELKNKQEPGSKATEDTIAFLRDAWDFKNLQISELPNGDWGQSVLKIFFLAHWQRQMYGKLIYSPIKNLSDVAEKALKEVTYHVRWSSDWVRRLGDGTEESRGRMQKALEYLWPYTQEFFEPEGYEWDGIFENAGEDFFENMKAGWNKEVSLVLTEASLTLPESHTYMRKGGKKGLHTEHLGHLLAEMQFLQRAYPGCEW
ncbi:MAG: phenylacetate-CoA oxygenase subunit PaaC [Chitinophagaceae bacterium]|nr:phenylacetate-CoA oxygenase subunit PaaC [Chitinophagaceae bacterium]